MFSFFAHPVYFYGIVVILLAVSLVSIFSYGEEDKRSHRKKEEEGLLAQNRIAELEKTLQDRETEYKATVAQREKNFKDSEAEFTKKIAALEEQTGTADGMKSHLTSLQSQLNVKEESCKQALSLKAQAEAALGALRQELEQAQKELALSNEMYNGLKGQYDELEEKFTGLTQQSPGTMPAHDGGEAPKPAFTLPKVPNLRAAVKDDEQATPPPASS